ncbi:hypothetical protein BDV95DRAFT_558683 [Massariosphaeria phaeospora]|uniref:Alpha/Beta hydrolase protein n=1 Tax=Massariosphaeria phaeospora TaxID=100035 RepID=A0A7C8IDX1_9PLEO|nr:hypothetical protein BDV95DRAFT_558683 [Massariosphaeria phaeospora]
MRMAPPKQDMHKLFPRKMSGDSKRAARQEESMRPIGTESGTAAMTPSQHYGTLTLSQPTTAKVDIVFVHGLMGDRRRTWTKSLSDEGLCFWPKDLLPDDLPHARIITWGYDADVVKPFNVVSVARLTQHAQHLCTELANIREETPNHLCGSQYGGIVTKHALLHSGDSNPPEQKSIVEDTSGIVFMGTPHSGSGSADLGHFFAALISKLHPANPTYLEELKDNSPSLQYLERRFNQLLTRRVESDNEIQIRCFCESLPTPGISNLVVPSYSAAPPHYEVIITMHADHIGMTKFDGREDQNYKNVLAELRRMIEKSKKQHEKDQDSSSDKRDDTRTGSGPVSHVGDNTHGALANYGTQSYGGDGIHHGNVNHFN